MGHLVGKDLYRKLGHKIDNQTMRAPWNESFYKILKELYTADEAELAVKMPYGLATLGKIAKVSGFNNDKLRGLLNGMADKGLVVDIGVGNHARYILSPLIIGIFEFTMMRTKGQLNHKEWARLFHDYLGNNNGFYKANLSQGQSVSILRTLPHEGTVEQSEYVEVLDFEKATSLIENSKRFAVGICSCRHEKYHIGKKTCDFPLETCTSFDGSADYLIRHNMAKEVSKTEMLELFARSKELGLVFCADNVKKNAAFVCHCCGCCCNVLLGISRFGYPNMVVTSNFIAKSDNDICSGCGECAENCPINAIEMSFDDEPIIDEKICIGCGVCALKCDTEAMRLTPRKQKVLYPEDTFEKIILQSLEKGTLQNFIFDNPQNIGHSFMRGFVGGFLKLPPIKRALMSNGLRSRFLETIKKSG